MFIITYRKLFLMIGAAIVLTAAAIVFTLGLKPGIDFTGGALTEVQYQTLPEKSAIEEVLRGNGLENSAIRQSAGELGTSYIITTRTLSVEEQKKVEADLLAVAPESKIIRTTSVGPVIGAELADKAYYALFAVSLMIIIYVAIAFVGIGTPVSSWVYGTMTVLVLVHDILVPVAVMSLLGYFAGLEVDVLFVTALLTILGYSVHDTVVIFDRVREKLQQNRTEHKKIVKRVGEMDRTEVSYTLNKPFDQLVGEAVD